MIRSFLTWFVYGLIFVLTALVIAALFIVFVPEAKAWPFSASTASHLNVAQRAIGTNPTGWSRNWCGKFVGDVLAKTGKPHGGNLARGYTRYGKASKCRPGAIAVMSSHVGFVQSCEADGVTVVSGNHAGRPGARTVGVGRYSYSRIIAFRMP